MDMKERLDHQTGPETYKRNIIINDVDGYWRLRFDHCIPLELSAAEQVELLYRDAYFDEISGSLAKRLGFADSTDIGSFRLKDFLPADLSTSRSLLNRLVTSNYRIDGCDLVARGRHGQRRVFKTNLAGEIRSGRLFGLWGTVKDITREKALEDELRLRSEIFDQLAEGCVIVEAPSENLVYVNQAFTEITGYAASDIGERKLSFLQGPDTDQSTVAEIREAIASDRPFTGEILHYKKDGTPFWNEMRISPRKDREGQVTHYVGILSDITEQKRLSEEIEEQRARLEHVTRVGAMGELATAITHELNQPLTSILSNAQAAQRFLTSTQPNLEEVREILKDIVSADNHASEVMRRMRRLVKSGQPHFVTLYINDVVKEVKKLVGHDMSMRRVHFEIKLTPGLPPVRGDAVQLQQILINLIVNARHAVQNLEPGRRNIVLTTASGADRSIEVAVSDSGPGVDEKLLDSIFQPFFSTKQDGLGMGLAINNTIVEAHGGHIWVENDVDSGAVFRVALPTTH